MGGGLILSVQFVAYIVMIIHAASELKDPSFTITVDHKGCNHIEADNLALAELTCDLKHVNVGIPLLLCLICVVLIFSDLAPDCVASLNVMFPLQVRPNGGGSDHRSTTCDRSFNASAFIFFESVLACTAGGMFSFMAMNEGNSADAIMNCVAVLFLHEIDEKLFPLFTHCKEENIRPCILIGLFLIVLAAFVGLLVVYIVVGGHMQ